MRLMTALFLILVFGQAALQTTLDALEKEGRREEKEVEVTKEEQKKKIEEALKPIYKIVNS